MSSVARETVTLFHSHGIGQFDFSALDPHDLVAVDEIATERGVLLCPTVFLRREYLDRFVALATEYHNRRASGEIRNIIGLSMEGPMLGRYGGVPRAACWSPSVDEWQTIIRLSSLGLRYIVVAPDAMELDEYIGPGYTFHNLLCECYDQGLRIALGHFVGRDNPERSAARLISVLDYLHSRYESSPYLVLTDHLYNDMPRSFIHAWRTAEERKARDQQIREFLTVSWERSNLAQVLGPVPAAILQSAREDRLTPALNFDGFHVDIEICKRTVEYLGAHRLIAMTDDTEVNLLAGEALHQKAGSPLRYRPDHVVAAGGSNYIAQRITMEMAGIAPDDIELMFSTVPEAALAYVPKPRA